MYKLNMKQTTNGTQRVPFLCSTRTAEDIRQSELDRQEAAKNPFVPGARIIRSSDAVARYREDTGCMQWFYPLSEVNDLGLFTYIEKEKKSDGEKAWVKRAHPDVNVYYYILEGCGEAVIGDEASGYPVEVHSFKVQELVIIPRDIPYTMKGGWRAVCFHTRTGVYGGRAGTVRYPHPMLIYDKPGRLSPEESQCLEEPGTLLYMDQTCTRGLRHRTKFIPFSANIIAPANQAPLAALNQLYGEITPSDPQTCRRSHSQQAAKNNAVLGARVLTKEDAPAVYNANAALKQSSYPLTWTDDIGICNLAEKHAESDAERPFDSHSHPGIEEYKFILSGSGSVTIGMGDDTCEQEYYEFKAGDLVILPRDLPHVDAGGYAAIYFHAKQSVFGQIPGNAMYPHVAYVYTKPSRPTAEEEAVLNDPGTYIMMNSRETYNIYCPNPIERVERNKTDMTHLRPDLFPEA